MPSASFLFSAVFRFRKVTQEIFLELHGTKTYCHIFPSCTRNPKGRRRGAPRLPHHVVARPYLPAREDMVWGPQAPPEAALSPINTSSMENPKDLIKHPRKVSSLLSSSTLDREGSGALPGTLPERSEERRVGKECRL